MTVIVLHLPNDDCTEVGLIVIPLTKTLMKITFQMVVIR